MMNRLRQEIKKLSLFSLSGVVNTVIGYTLIFSFMFLGLTPFLSNVLGYSIGFFFSFFMGKYVVFRSQEKKLSELIRYFLVFALAYLINAFMLHYSLKLGISPYLCQLFGGIAFSTTNYTLSRIWVFK
jgi:putative flippase GtrA